MVTFGQKEFQTLYSDVSRRMDQTSEAGAEIIARAEIGKIVLFRGTICVVKP